MTRSGASKSKRRNQPNRLRRDSDFVNLYQHPKYYEVAFSFRNIPQEVDFFESAIEKFSRIKVKSFFELASGTSPYLEEWHKRGYRYIGLDKSSEMLAFFPEVSPREKHRR